MQVLTQTGVYEALVGADVNGGEEYAQNLQEDLDAIAVLHFHLQNIKSNWNT